MTKFDRYLKIVYWARERYTKNNWLPLNIIGGRPSPYSLIEDAAAEKYLGCARRYPKEEKVMSTPFLVEKYFFIVAGQAVVDQIREERANLVKSLIDHQKDLYERGFRGIEIIQTSRGFSCRYDSGLQNFSLLARFPSLYEAEQWAKTWQSSNPTRRYAWRRHTAP